MNVVLSAAAALTLSAAPLSAQWGGIFGSRSNSSGVPAGHMPSRGMCRVWIDGVPPGQQPRQTDCRTAERQRPYYEQRYGRNARVIYGDRSNNGRYDTRNGAVVLGKSNGSVYGDGNCRYVERVVAGRVIRQRVCDNNGGVYDRDGRVYDRNGNVVYRRDGVYRDSRGRVIRRDDGVWRDNRGRVYDRRGRNDRDSDSDKWKGKGKGKNKNKGNNGRWGR